MAGLDIGETSIDRSRASKDEAGTWHLRWYIRMPDGRLLKKHSKGRTKGAVRRNAHEKAEQIQAGFSESTWSGADPMVDYLDLVTRPAIERAELRQRSKDRYLQVLGYLQGQCKAGHQPRHTFASQTIAVATRFRSIEAVLDQMEEDHGVETRHQTRTVISHYVLEQMMRDELIAANPLLGRQLPPKKTVSTREVLVLDVKQWASVLDYLLELDPAEGVSRPKRGMYTLADRIARRATVIDLTLLQATTALRISEAASLRWGQQMIVDQDQRIIINVTEELSKTGTQRWIGVGDPRVEQRLLQRGQSLTQGWPVFGSPAKPDHLWNKRQRDEAIRGLYDEMAENLQLPVLSQRRTHVWRATLNTMLQELPAAQRAAHLGHGVQVNKKSYTSLADGSIFTDHLRDLLADRVQEADQGAP